MHVRKNKLQLQVMQSGRLYVMTSDIFHGYTLGKLYEMQMANEMQVTFGVLGGMKMTNDLLHIRKFWFLPL